MDRGKIVGVLGHILGVGIPSRKVSKISGPFSRKAVFFCGEIGQK